MPASFRKRPLACLLTGPSVALLSALTLLTLAPQAFADQEALPSLTFTTLNIKFYGLNGSFTGDLGSETRARTVKTFLKSNDLLTDVMAFQEIVDDAGLKRNVLGSDYTCKSYEHDDERHQHVVLCVKKPLKLEMSVDDDDFALQAVSPDGSRRPAVHGIVQLADGTPFAHVFAVHLKSAPMFSAMRLGQVTAIKDFIESRSDDLPSLVLGDFNTFDDDVETMSKVLGDVGLEYVSHRFPHTFRSTRSNGSLFDHVWIDEKLRTVGNAKVLGPCNDGTDGADAYDRERLVTYNLQVSDHCPLTVKVARRAS